VAAGNRSGSGLKVWEVETGKLVVDLPTWGNAAALFSPDGKWLAVGSAGEGYVLREPGTWRVVRALPSDNDLYYGGMMAFSPDGRVLALVYGQEVKLFDPATGREFATLADPRHRGIPTLRFGPDGSWLVATENGGLRIWNLRRVREALSAMGLDWDQPPYPPRVSPGRP
jgi:WD40 repeat protein